MTELYPILTLDIPKSQKQPIGFLEIIKKQYHENINSSIYAHFINCEEKAVSEMFMDALTDLIEEKTNRLFSLGAPYATCEVVTQNGRIDIVIQDRLSEQVILIENKIFHHLHNDLTDYWNHFNCSEEHKIGVLLTPYPHKVPDANKETFINITHVEWIQKVKEKGIPFNLSNKYTIYITDFVNTIDQFSTNYAMDEQAKFYFEHALKILKIQETTTAAHQFLNNQFQLIASRLGWQTYGNAIEWRNFWDEQNHLDTYLTIVTEPLLNGEMKFLLILELMRLDKDNVSKLEEHLKDNAQFKRMKRGGTVGRDKLHFGMIEYSISLEQLENLADFVYQKIMEDFADTTLKAIKFFYPNKDISVWEENFSYTPVIQSSPN